MLPPQNSLAYQDDTERFYRDFAAEEHGRRLEKKFKDDEKEIQAEFCAEIGFGLHNLIGTTQPATGAPDPYGGPPQFKPPPNFAP